MRLERQGLVQDGPPALPLPRSGTVMSDLGRILHPQISEKCRFSEPKILFVMETKIMVRKLNFFLIQIKSKYQNEHVLPISHFFNVASRKNKFFCSKNRNFSGI